MKKYFLAIAALGLMTTGATTDAFAGGYPDYPASHKYQKAYKHAQYWAQHKEEINAESKQTKRSSAYPKSAEYQRRERRVND